MILFQFDLKILETLMFSITLNNFVFKTMLKKFFFFGYKPSDKLNFRPLNLWHFFLSQLDPSLSLNEFIYNNFKHFYY